VYGLANYADDGSFQLLVPMPMWNGTSKYTAAQVSSGTFTVPGNNTTQDGWVVSKDWSAMPVDTEHGPMIALTLKNSSNMSNFTYHLAADKDVSGSEVEQLSIEVLSASIMFPNASTNVKGNYSVNDTWYNSRRKNCSSYTSYISIGHGLTPAQTSADTDNISIMGDYNVQISSPYNEKMPESNRKESGQYIVYSENRFNVSTPQGTSGWIPVTVSNFTNTYNDPRVTDIGLAIC